MPSHRNQASHAAVWDDTALVDSWNEALEEYQRYHSIHTKGGSLQDLRELESSIIQERGANDVARDEECGENEAGQDQECLGQQISSQEDGELQSAADDAEISHKIPLTEAVEPSSSETVQRASPAPAPALMGSNDGLRKLLMSWYYAGYYTGLYEEQQQSQHPAS